VRETRLPIENRMLRDQWLRDQGRPQADAQDARASTKLMDLEVCLSNCLT